MPRVNNKNNSSEDTNNLPNGSEETEETIFGTLIRKTQEKKKKARLHESSYAKQAT